MQNKVHFGLKAFQRCLMAVMLALSFAAYTGCSGSGNDGPTVNPATTTPYSDPITVNDRRRFPQLPWDPICCATSW